MRRCAATGVDLQVLRAVAVLLVVAYHARLPVPGGFTGVDVFFVISGFVIGRNLVAQLVSSGTVSLRSFATRRARRLLPALAVMLCTVVLAAPWLAPIGAASVTSRTALAASLSASNLYLWASSPVGYFSSAAEWNPLLHTWSLSLEEQFYLVVPLALGLLWRAGRRSADPLRRLRIGIAALASLSFVLCVSLSLAGPDGLRAAFYSPVTRAWEFAVGLALAVLPRTLVGGEIARRAARVLGAGLLVWAALAFSGSTVFPGVAAAVPVLGTAALIWAGTTVERAGPDRRAPGPLTRSMVWLGDRSYGWYLWHWPLIVFAAACWPTAGRWPLVLAAVVSLVPACASARWWEGRDRSSTDRSATDRSARPTARLVAVCVLAPISAAVVSAWLGQVVERTPAVQAADGGGDHAGARAGCNNPVPLGERSDTSCSWGPADATTSVVLIGDSNADQLTETLVGATEQVGAQLRVATMAGCPVLDVRVRAAWFDDGGAACGRFVDRTVAALVEDPPDVVVLSNATDKYLFGDEALPVDPRTGEPTHQPTARAELVRQGLERTAAQLRDAGSKVVVVQVVPKPMWRDVDFDARSCSAVLLVVQPDRCAMPEFVPAHPTLAAQDLERSAATAADVATWNLDGVLCPDRRCAADPQRARWWHEPQHLSVSGARALVPTVADSLAQLRTG